MGQLARLRQTTRDQAGRDAIALALTTHHEVSRGGVVLIRRSDGSVQEVKLR